MNDKKFTASPDDIRDVKDHSKKLQEYIVQYLDGHDKNIARAVIAAIVPYLIYKYSETSVEAIVFKHAIDTFYAKTVIEMIEEDEENG